MTWTTQAWGHDGKTYDGKDMRELVEAVFYNSPGVVHGLAVSQQGSPNTTVKVALGKAIVAATGAGLLGQYHAWNDADVDSPSFTATTTNGRKDRLILRITAGVPALEIVEGTPSGSPVEPAITGDNYLELALITMPGSTTNITNAMITDRRVYATAIGGQGVALSSALPVSGTRPGLGFFETDLGQIVRRNAADSAWLPWGNFIVCTSGTRPSPASEGMMIYETNTDLMFIYNGSAWIQITPESATVATNQTTTSSTFTDLATTGPAVTLETGAKVIVDVSCDCDAVGTAVIGWMGFAVSGATTIAASANSSLKLTVSSGAGWPVSGSRRIYLSTLTPGTNVFTAKYLDYVGGGTGAKFFDRSITVTPLPG